MSDRHSIDAAKKAVRRAGAQQPPAAETFLPEIRSNIKWKMTTLSVVPFRPDALVTLVWSFGVPFKDIDALHGWLATNEVTLASECNAKTNGQAAYLGTYLHLDTGSPRYQTMWGLRDDSSAEQALKAALVPDNQLLFNLTKVLRGYWSRDPGASDHRYGLARSYIQLASLPIDSAFWTVTRESAGELPQT